MPIDEIGDRALNIGVALHELSAHAGSPEELFLNWTSDPSADKKGSQAMTMTSLVRSELRKLTSTKMPFALLGVLVVLAGLNAFAVIAGTDADGSKAFVATAADQQSLVAFAAIAIAREYGHHTVVPTFLASPRRYRAVLGQLTAVAGVGRVLSVIGAGLTVTAVALALPTTDHGFLVSAGDVVRVVAASGFAGAAGAILGAGIGAVVRNVGGAVTSTVLVLIIAPPLVVQLVNGSGSWMPGILANVVFGTATDVAAPAALAALVAWAIIPAMVGLIAVQRRDVVRR